MPQLHGAAVRCSTAGTRGGQSRLLNCANGGTKLVLPPNPHLLTTVYLPYMQLLASLRFRSSVLVLLASAGLAAASGMPASPAVPVAPIAPAAPAAPAVPVVDGFDRTPVGVALGDSTIGRATVLYAGYKSYSDVLKLSTDIRVRTPQGENPQNMEDSISFAYEAKGDGAGDYALSNNDAGFYSMGRSRTVHLKQTKQYVQNEDGLDMSAVAGPLETILTIHPVAALLLKKTEGRPFPMIDEVLGAKRDMADGKPVVRVIGKAKLPFGFGNDPVDVELSFADATGELLNIDINMLETMKKMFADQMAQMPVEMRDKFVVTPINASMKLQLASVEVNKPIEAAKLTFKPSDKDKKVADVQAAMQPDEGSGPEKAVGTAAANFTAPLLSGGELELASLKGKVVVMDFWATWCPPCVKAVPHIQKLHEDFEKQGVVVLGINQDRGATEKVQKYVDDNKVTFRQVMDKESSIASDYSIQGIPALFIADKEGIVQYVHIGFAEGQEKEIRAALEAVLAGKKPQPPAAEGAEPKSGEKPETKPEVKPEVKPESAPEPKPAPAPAASPK